jgi:hypothetical protein
MDDALRAASGATVYLYATEAGRPLYARLGFRVADTVTAYCGRYQGSGGPPRAADLLAAGTGGLPTLARLDRQAFGADRSTLLRRLPGFADRVVIMAGGYSAAWRNLDTVHAGPLVADSTSTAQALLDAVLPEGTATARVDLPAEAAGALGGWLAARGLTARSPAPLMVRGPELPGNRAVQLAPLMQALG